MSENYSVTRKDKLEFENRGAILALRSLSRNFLSENPADGLNAALDFLDTFLRPDAAFILMKEVWSDRFAIAASRNLPEGLRYTDPCPAESLAREAMAERQALSVAQGRVGRGSFPQELSVPGFIWAAASPIAVGGNAIGCIILCSKTVRTLTSEDRKLLRQLSDTVADSMIERRIGWRIVPEESAKLSISEAETRLEELQSVTTLMDSIARATSVESLLDIVVEHSMAAAGAKLGSISLFDPKTKKSTVHARHGYGDEHDAPREYALGQGITGWVVKNLRPLLIKDIEHSPQFADEHRWLIEKYRLSSVLSVPLQTRDHLIGSLNLGRVKGQAPFNRFQLDLFEMVGSQAAIAIERMRLNEEIKRRSLQLATLMEIGRTISSMLDLEAVVEQIAIQTRHLSRSDASMLFYYDPINDRVRYASQSGCPAEMEKDYLDLGQDLALAAARLNRLTYAHEIRDTDIQMKVGDLWADNWLAVPFRHRGHRMAVAVMVPREGAQTDPSLGELLEQLGSLAAVAIQNARVYNRQVAMARVMRESVLNARPVSMDGLEVAHRLIPAHEVGGDYYDFIPLGEGRLGIVMADVCGSSVRAATYITVGKHALRAYARECQCPAEALTRLNRLIHEESDAEIFISLFYGILDMQDSSLTFAMAGHEPPILVPSGVAEAQLLAAPGMLLGVMAEVEFESQKIPFNPGDLLALYTDGLTEVRIRKERFGVDRLAEMILRYSSHSAQDIVDKVVGDRMRFSLNQNPDDMALVVLRRSLY